MCDAKALHREWLRGVTAALAPLAQFGEDTIYDEVVSSAGSKEVIQQARRDGAMRWSGLSRYVRRHREDE